MMLVIGLRSEANGGANNRRVLAGLQHFKTLAFPTKSGKFVKATVDFVYATTPNNNQERIDKAVALHTHSSRRDDGTGPTYCDYCNGHPAFPCETVRILTGST